MRKSDEFFKSQGTVIVNDAADFTGANGCYLYQGRDVKPSKKNGLKGQMLALAPHEDIIPADIWLACRKKLMNNMLVFHLEIRRGQSTKSQES